MVSFTRKISLSPLSLKTFIFDSTNSSIRLRVPSEIGALNSKFCGIRGLHFYHQFRRQKRGNPRNAISSIWTHMLQIKGLTINQIKLNYLCNDQLYKMYSQLLTSRLFTDPKFITMDKVFLFSIGVLCMFSAVLASDSGQGKFCRA